MKWDYADMEEFAATGPGLFITNEGNFQYGNATLSYYDPATKKVENEVFYRANAMKLGDVAQSMTIHNDLGWIVVNNSHVVFAIDLRTFKEVGRITNLTSPRYIHFVSDEKAYVTQLWDNRIFIVNPRRYEITGYIECPGMTPGSGSTEQMVQYGQYVYVNCWSYQNRLLKIDTRTDRVVDELVVGVQPTSLVLDANDKLWTITDGGYEGSPYGYDVPALYRIDAASFRLEKQFRFREGDAPSEVQLNGTRDTLYWINKDVWRMPVAAEQLPALRMQHRYEITAVIDDDIRFDIECFVNKSIIFLRRTPVPGEYIQPVLYECRGNIILRGQWIAARNGDFGTGIFEDQCHIGRLCFQMKSNDHFLTSERFGNRKLLIDRCQYRHEVGNPVDFIMAGRSQLDIADHRFHYNTSKILR